MNELEKRITANVNDVKERIETAISRSARVPGSVRLIAVSKYSKPDDGTVPALIASGCRDFGESRPQSLLEKIEYFRNRSIPEVRWHMIGSLQRNKIRKVLPHIELIHSIDSVRLLEAIDRIAGEENLRANLLLEVNVSGEPNKQGFKAAEMRSVLAEIAPFQNVRIRGLMCMGGLESTPEENRTEFASLRELSESLKNESPDNTRFEELSMGMSEDFEIAIEEGATIIRIGSRLIE